MKFVRFGAPGAEKPGLVDSDGKIRDLSAHVEDFKGEALDPANLAKLKSIDPASLPLAPEGARLGPPIAGTLNYIGIGLNYADHAAEAGLRIPREPVLFNKIACCICGPDDDTMMPFEGEKLDYEVEIGFVIGKRARYVDEADANDYIAGYCVCNDVSERHFQTERSGQWVKGKSFETFGPIGPWLVTKDELDLDNLGLWLDVNGERRQTGSTSNMVFKIPYMLSYISRFMILEPGDVVTTGTPPGVALGMKPEPVWLKVGDEVRLGIDGLGEQRQKVVAFKK